MINPDAYKSRQTGNADSIYEETQALMFGGGDTTANTLMYGTFHLLKNPAMESRLRKELREAWPDSSSEPTLKQLETLPYLVSSILQARALLTYFRML